MGRCIRCGGRMVDLGFPDHPTCADEPDAARIRADHEAHELKLVGLDQAADASPDDFTVASAIIRAAAVSMRTFSANDLRQFDPRWEQLGSKVRGAAMSHAARRRIARKSGKREPSSSSATHAHEIDIWESQIFVDEYASAAGLLTGQAS